MSKSIQSLPQQQAYPAAADGIDLNTCGNYGVAPDPLYARFRGPGGAKKRLAMSISSPAIAAGGGHYVLDAPSKELGRASDVLEYESDPHTWSDGRTLVCHHARGNATCDISHLILSNDHLETEAERLRHHNGLLLGPACGACGRRYLDAPDEFALNGANGKVGARPRGVRLIHKPCRGQKGARITVSPEHAHQEDRSDNLQILTQIVNEAGLNALRRILEPASGEREVGIQRIYDRIFWLERVLLAYERAQRSARADLLRQAGGRGTRSEDAYINGACYSPRSSRPCSPSSASITTSSSPASMSRRSTSTTRPTTSPMASRASECRAPRRGS